MAKQVKKVIKLQVRAGQANPAPPVGPALGQHGLNIQDFCMKFNDATKEKMGDLIPVEISVYEDRTFSFILKTPPASELLKKAANVQKGSGKVSVEKVGKVTIDQIREIAEIKMPDLNAKDVAGAINIVKGTARSMGIDVI